jgi:hypothetical protein
MGSSDPMLAERGRRLNDHLGEELGRFIGLDDLGERIIERLDRIERRLDRLNITPAELDALEVARATLEGADRRLDAIEPEAGDAQ